MNQDTTKKMIVALQEVLSQEINTFDALQKEHSNDSVWVEFCQHNKQILHQSFTAQINYYTKSLCLKKTS